MNEERISEEMKCEFIAFCKTLLRLLELGETQSAIDILKSIVK